MMYIKDVYGDISADHKARIQIRETIKAHFRKEASLFKRGIKTLSLFSWMKLPTIGNMMKTDSKRLDVMVKYSSKNIEQN